MFVLQNIQYKNILAIDQLKIPNNLVTCIVGKSGSGKTTLAKLFNGLISPDTGTILFNGELLDEKDLVMHRRKVIMLQQTPSIYEGTIRENLQIGRQFAELEKADDDLLNDALRIAHLDKDLGTEAADLSGGEKQRLALARVLLLENEVLILDEPTSALDEETAEEILTDILKVCREKGQTVLMITHSMHTVEQFADNVVEIDQGSIVYSGRYIAWNKA